MIKKILTALSLVIFVSTSMFSQRIAIVDINEVLGSFSDYQAAEENIDKVASQWQQDIAQEYDCLLYTSPSPRDRQKSRMPSSA